MKKIPIIDHLPCGHPVGCERDWESGTDYYEGMPEKQCLWCRDITRKKTSDGALALAKEEHVQMRKMIKKITGIAEMAHRERTCWTSEDVAALESIRLMGIATLETTCETKIKARTEIGNEN